MSVKEVNPEMLKKEKAFKHEKNDVCECGHNKKWHAENLHDDFGECFRKIGRGWCSCKKFKPKNKK